jgi:hypothetical protein
LATRRSRERRLEVGRPGLEPHLAKYRGHELAIIIAAVGKAGEIKRTYVCGICGFVMTGLGECLRRKVQVEETARDLRRMRQQHMLLREIDDFIEGRWHDPGGTERVG